MLKTHYSTGFSQQLLLFFFSISHKENGKPRRNGRESGDYCSHHPGELELNATSRHKYSNIWLVVRLSSPTLYVMMGCFYWLLGFQRSSAVRLHVWLGQSAAGSGGHGSVSAVHACTPLQVHSQMTIISLKNKKLMHFLQFCYCSLARRNQAAEACDFDPSLLLDHTSITVLQHLLRWVEHAFRGRPTDARV